MTLPTIQVAVNAGEISPSLFGRVDLEKYKKGTATQRNMFASYRGGSYSRPGTRFVGICKQGNEGAAASVLPPRNIPFQFSVTQGIVIEAGNQYFRFVSNGGYVVEATTAITGITQASPGVVTDNAHGYSNGDEVYLASIGGMTVLNGRSYLVANATANTFTLVDPLTGNGISTASLPAYTSGGTAARIYTLATPYVIADVPMLKFTQSADIMTITHENYAPRDLARVTSNNWTLTVTDFSPSIAQPTWMTATASTTASLATQSFYYQLCATAVDAKTGVESIASPVVTVPSVDIASQAGSLYLSCASVSTAGSYNFYAATPAYASPPSGGQLLGYIGTSFGPAFTDTNIVPDFNTTPPLHHNPFATSSVLAVAMTSTGTSYSATATTATVSSPIGKNPVLLPVVINGAVEWVSVQDGGEGMTGGEVINFVDATGAGSGAAATFTVGPSTGTWPSCVAYFQQRRVYANTTNAPDTYFASQPGAFTNMDVSVPVKDSDAIVGSPWSQEVNGIQWMLNMPGGLVIFTGLGAWQLSGSGSGLSVSTALTPSSQVATPQAYNGISPLVGPLVINYDILYVQEKGSIVRDLSYNFFVNIYTGTDMTVLSNHLFDGHTILQWAWAEEPFKLVWAVRDDGILLCLTYLKEQEVYSWTRHDTNGLYQSVCSVSEPPVNAVYVIVKRLIQNNGVPLWAYFQERMDNRLWTGIDDVWCVDAGLAYPQAEPNATLTVSSAAGVPTLQQPTLVYGGSGYGTGTYARIDDPTGSGAIPAITVTGGVVTAASVGGTLTGYTSPRFVVVDPTGAGGGAAVTIESLDITTITASSAVFANVAGSGEAGDIINMSGRLMRVTEFVSSTSLMAAVLRDNAPSIANDPLNTPIPAVSGEWTIAAPVTTLTGLNHLEGMQVSILADGVIVAPQTVADGAVTLPTPASNVVVGLGFTAQLQTLYLDVPAPVTVQGRRKEIDQVVVRLESSGTPLQIGTNQPDASTQPGNVTVPWTNMTSVNTFASISGPAPQQPFDLFTGDVIANVNDVLGYDRGQVALQQSNPVPMNILAVIPWSRIQDDADAA